MFKKNLHYPNFSYWVKQISITGGAQIIIQVLGLVGGIILIRTLSLQEYAWYTLANTMLGALVIFSDSGIIAGVLSEGSKVWHDKTKLSSVMSTGMALRKKFAIVSLFLVSPVLFIFLVKKGASQVYAFLLTLALLPAFLSTLTDALYEIPLKLNQNIRFLQKNQLIVSILRMILILSMYVLPQSAFIALIFNGIPRYLGNVSLKKKYETYIISTNNSENKQVRANILDLVKRLLPEGIYSCFSGQITIWLISIFGNTSALGQLGAMLRLYIAFSFFNVFINTLLVPKFAKIEQGSKLLKKVFWQMQFLFISVCIFILTLTFYTSNYILDFFGSEYGGLNTEVFFVILWASLNLMYTLTFSLNTSKAWAINPIISIPINLISQGLGILFFDIATLKGVLFMACFSELIKYFMGLSYFIYKSRCNSTKKI